MTPKIRHFTLMCFCLLAPSFDSFASAPAPAADAESIRPVEVGKSLPQCDLKDFEGKKVPVADLHREGPVVIVFYRGDWCPYCNAHLRKLQEIETDLTRLGFSLVAVSPDKPETLPRTSEKEKISYRLLSDSDMEASLALGIAFKVDDLTIEKYKEYEIDLTKASGRDHHLLPVPSVFLVGKDGTILWSHIDPDYSQRLEPEALLDAAAAAAAP